MTRDAPRTDELLAAFRDLAAGRGVRRGRHDLRLEGRDRSALFEKALRLEGFEPLRVREAQVEMGEKAPPTRVVFLDENNAIIETRVGKQAETASGRPGALR